jgi:glycosyltransferase involved in cell wall biosynthesis
MNSTVSICIPTYNGDKYLKECLDSVLAQTFSDFEVLIVDDRSSDETVNIAKEYADRDRRIQVRINERNLGLVGNWNRCVELAQGEWIKFVHQDDSLEPECLERMLAASSKTNSAIIFCRREFLFEAGISEEIRRYHLANLSLLDRLFSSGTEMFAKEYCQIVLNQIKDNKIYLNFVGEPIAVMLHRRVFHEFGNFNPYLIQGCDLEYWTRVASHTGIIYVPDTLATYRLHNESTSAINSSSRQYRKSVLEFLIILHDFAFHPTYMPLRAIACQQSSVNLTNVLANKAYEARRIAERAAADPVNPNPSLLLEWEKLLELYPILLRLSQRSFFKRIIIHSIYRWRQFQR